MSVKSDYQVSARLEAVLDCITGQFQRAAQLTETLTGKEAATVWFTHVRAQTEPECKPGPRSE